MKIYTKIVWDWDGHVLESVSYEYSGPVALACGAPSGQTNLANQQANYYQTLTQNAQQEFGQASSLATEFMNEFEPIFAAGPDQLGWSPTVAANVNSNTVTTEGQATANAMKASNLTTNALGGGNEYTPSGAVKEGKTAINVTGAQTTASQQQSNLLADYQQGNANFNTAAAGLESIPNFYSGSTSASSAANSGGSAANSTFTDVAQESFAPLGAALGAVGAAAGGLSGTDLSKL